MLIKNLQKLESLIKRRFSSFSMTTAPKNVDGYYVILLNLENEIDDDVKKEIENTPSVTIKYKNIPADFMGFTHQYLMIVDDKKSEWELTNQHLYK